MILKGKVGETGADGIEANKFLKLSKQSKVL